MVGSGGREFTSQNTRYCRSEHHASSHDINQKAKKQSFSNIPLLSKGKTFLRTPSKLLLRSHGPGQILFPYLAAREAGKQVSGSDSIMGGGFKKGCGMTIEQATQTQFLPTPKVPRVRNQVIHRGMLGNTNISWSSIYRSKKESLISF